MSGSLGEGLVLLPPLGVEISLSEKALPSVVLVTGTLKANMPPTMALVTLKGLGVQSGCCCTITGGAIGVGLSWS